VAIAAAAIAAPHALAARGLTVGFGDPAFRDGGRERALDLSVAAGAKVVRIGVDWSAVAPNRPLTPTNPADPAYRFAGVDAAVRAAAARGLDVLLEVGRAPAWAEGPGRPSTAEARAGTWRPDPAAFGQFARAVASRYAGNFSPAPTQPALPGVSRYQAWNEPNLSAYLTPQGSADRPEAAAIYRDLLAAFADGVKSVNGGATVVTAGTAPYGGATASGSQRSHPVSFLRELFCLNGDGGCGQVRFDVLAHHPINAGDPFAGADDPRDATTPDLGRVRDVLREAERRGTVADGRHPVWVTEFWWETDPPDSTYGVPERVQARYTAEALYLFWKQRVPLVLGLQLADSPMDPAAPGDSFQTGLYFEDGRAKDSLKAFRFPLVAIRGKRAIRAWTRSPAGGKLRIERRRKGRWRAVERERVAAGEVFRARIKGAKRAKLRARVRGERSLRYKPRRAK
jgi:hypothetical protein